MRIAVGIIVVLLLIAFYFVGWKLNSRQEKPQGKGSSLDSCGTCATGCGTTPEKKGN